MNITHIAGNGIKGRSFAHDITQPVVIFTGKNGAGKTTRLQAVELALRGPKKDDTRFDADKASCHVSIAVDASVHVGARAEVLRGLGPKHTLAVQPLSKPGKPVTAAQAELDMLVQLPSVTFDIGAFTGLSADKQKAALLPYARHVDAQQYAGIYPSVAPFSGEAGSDYLGRLRAAINEETKALSARKLAAERAQAQLAENAGHSARPAGKIKEDIAAAVAQRRSAVALAEVARLEVLYAGMVEQYTGRQDSVLTLDKSAAELRAELNDVETQLETWKQVALEVQRLDAAAQDVTRTAAALEQANENLAQVGGGAQFDADQHAQLLNEMDAHRGASAAYVDARRQHARLGAELANARFEQIEALALLAVIEASPEPAPLHIGELRDLLLRAGFPSSGLINRQLEEQAAAMAAARDAMHPDADGLLLRMEAMERAHMSAGITASLRATAQAAADDVDRATCHLDGLKKSVLLPTGTERDHLRLLTRRDSVIAELQFAERAEKDAANKSEANRGLSDRLHQAKASAELARQELAAAEAVVPVGDATPELMDERIGALQRELDDAVRAEGRIEAERGAYQDAESAKVALAAAKDAEKRAKEASDECLRSAMGGVADAFAPFCAMLSGTWALGDKDPLGLERSGVWVGYDDLSESERLVYGIGLVLALSTLGKGLRLVMLDGLDDCDVERRRAIIAEALKLVAAGKLDNVLGTAWSADGFDAAGVQVIGV